MCIPFVVMKWTRSAENRDFKKYTAEHVNCFYDMLKSTQTQPFRLFCLTDDGHGVDPAIEVLPLPKEVVELIESYGRQFCKLYLFSRDVRQKFDRSFIYSDLDVGILGDLTCLSGGDESLVIMEGENGMFLDKAQTINRAPLPEHRSLKLALRLLQQSALSDAIRYMAIRPKKWCKFNSSFMVIAADQPDEVWEEFSPLLAQDEIKSNNLVGSDQAWLHLHKKGKIKIVNQEDGFWRKREIDRVYKKTGKIPDGTKMIIFAGQHSKPWSAKNNNSEWIHKILPVSA